MTDNTSTQADEIGDPAAARLRATVVQRTVPPPEDDELTWRYAVQMVAADSLWLADEVDRLREFAQAARSLAHSGDCDVCGATDELLDLVVRHGIEKR